LSGIGKAAGGKVVVDFCADGSQCGAELLLAQPATFSLGCYPKFVDQAWGKICDEAGWILS